jgi:mannose-6-phosphate isomerase-like protein (cupin superfamily)
MSPAWNFAAAVRIADWQVRGSFGIIGIHRDEIDPAGGFMDGVIDEAAFRQDLAARGCTESRFVVYEANRFNPEHHHDFTARGLVLEGDFEIATADGTKRFGPGDIFEVPAGTNHTERAGADGASIVSGRFF